MLSVFVCVVVLNFMNANIFNSRKIYTRMYVCIYILVHERTMSGHAITQYVQTHA